ncbi:MAG: PD-(D/E)XK nuclease family protein, partial [Ruminococcus sp.]|nr:PD-(D/E)XK nuclease family protein [Ruminococcus sp.]
GNRKVAPGRFCELLNLQFTAQDISFIPHAVDQVIVGDIDRLRLSSKKAVFVIGAVEGEFPRTNPTKGLFTGSERELLADAGLFRDTSPQTQALTEEYLCYYALTSASDKLFVSYPCADLKGNVIYPSKLFTQLNVLCPAVKAVLFSDVPPLELLWSPKAAFRIYAGRSAAQDELTNALSEYYSSNEEFSSSAKALKRAVSRADFRISDPVNARKLFGENMYLSASQVEKYHLCRFMYFCTYGLRIKERRAAQIDAMEYGSFVHYILEHFLKKYSKEQMLSVSDEQISDDINSLMSQYAAEHFGGTQDKSERFLYLYSRVSLYVHKLIKHLIEELSQSSFTPEAFELDIGRDVPAYSLTLPTGQTVTIRGKVDRADLMRKDDRTYIRVVDYKTGSKIFDLSDIMYGLNLQMLIYLSALTKDSSGFTDEALIPAGVLYMPSMVPVINAAFDDSAEKIMAEQNKKLRMNGLILKDMDVIDGMERNGMGVYIPVSSKGDSVKGTDNLASLEEFGAVFAHIDRLIAQMATELTNGRVEAMPAKGGYDACEYCPYKAVCGHKDSDRQRTIYKLDRAEIIKKLGLKEEEVAP